MPTIRFCAQSRHEKRDRNIAKSQHCVSVIEISLYGWLMKAGVLTGKLIATAFCYSNDVSPISLKHTPASSIHL